MNLVVFVFLQGSVTARIGPPVTPAPGSGQEGMTTRAHAEVGDVSRERMAFGEECLAQRPIRLEAIRSGATLPIGPIMSHAGGTPLLWVCEGAIGKTGAAIGDEWLEIRVRIRTVTQAACEQCNDKGARSHARACR